MLRYINWIIVEICTLPRVEKLEHKPDLLWLIQNPVGLSTHIPRTAGIKRTKRTLSQVGHDTFQKFSAAIVTLHT